MALMGGITLISVNITDRALFNELLLNLGSFGGFLSGIGTIIVAAAAAAGVDTWSKQLKNGKFLTSIWDAKVLVNKFDTEFHFWSVFYKSNAPDLKEQSEQCEKEIFSCLKALEELAHIFDSLSSEADEVWGDNIRGLKIFWETYKRYLDTIDFSPTDDESLTNQAIKSIQFFNKKKSYLSELRRKLDKLETKCAN